MRFSLTVILILLVGTCSAQADPSALVTLATAYRGDLSPVVQAYGTVASDPNHQISVVAGHDARLGQVFVRLGQHVQKDAPIVELQNTPATIAAFTQAASALSFAAKDFQQTQRLYNEQLATRSQLAAAQKALLDAQSTMQQQRLTGADQARQTLRAPASGVVVALGGGRGDAVAANANVATIAAEGGVVVNIGIEPNVAANVHRGASVQLLSPDSLKTMASQIVSVGSMLDPQSRLVNAVARAPDVPLLVGMSLQARIALAPQRGIIVTRSALLSDQDGTFVLVVSGGKAHHRSVRIAFEANQDALVASGLKDNEKVIIAGAEGVDDNMAVRTR